MSAMPAEHPRTCPPWCCKAGEPHEFCGSDIQAGTSGGLCARLLLADDFHGHPWPEPRVHVVHHGAPFGHGVLLNLREGRGLAGLFGALGHKELAAVIVKVIDLHQEETGDE